MKHITFYLIMLAAAILASPATAQTNPNSKLLVNIHLDETGDEYVYLSRRDAGDWINLDSAKRSVSTIQLSGQLEAPEMMYLRIENNDTYISFFAEPGEISITPDMDNPEGSLVEGSETHTEYRAYQSFFKPLNEEKDQLYKAYREARASGDAAKTDSVVALFDGLSEKEMAMNRDWVTGHTSSWISPYIIRRAMVFTLSLDELKEITALMDASLEPSIYLKDLKQHIAILEKVAIGKAFTDFSLPTPEGEELSLSELVGKNYLLIDFWASWCGPCRRENPNVVALYEQYKDKGFDILGVSFDTKEENWLKAIDDDQLSWHHVSDLKGWGSAAGKLYGVNSIPHTVLLSPEGIILEKNIRGDALARRMKELLGEE